MRVRRFEILLGMLFLGSLLILINVNLAYASPGCCQFYDYLLGDYCTDSFTQYDCEVTYGGYYYSTQTCNGATGYCRVPPCTPSCPGDQCGQDNGCGSPCPDTDIDRCGKCGNPAVGTACNDGNLCTPPESDRYQDYLGSCICLGDAKVCNTPPSSTCVGNTKRVYNSPGSCNSGDGKCYYTSYTDTDCGKTSYCFGGSCIVCPVGTGNCDQNPSNACEVNTNTDNNNCGSCGNDCTLSGKTCSGGICVAPCTNDCSPSGARQCSGTTSYQTCGNYDADGCLEWSSVTPCPSGTCSGGNCVPTADTTPPTGSILISSMSGDTTYTKSTSVTLTLTCTDASGCSQMRFSDDGSVWTAPMTYTSPKPWVTTAGDGTKTIYTRFIDTVGNEMSAPGVSDTIILDTTLPTSTITSPAAGSTFSSDFSVSVTDSDTGSGVKTCYYHVKDSSAGWTKSWATRTCNSTFPVTVGIGDATKDCRTEGSNTCTVYVFSEDNAGNRMDPAYTRSYSISSRLQPPELVSPKDATTLPSPPLLTWDASKIPQAKCYKVWITISAVDQFVEEFSDVTKDTFYDSSRAIKPTDYFGHWWQVAASTDENCEPTSAFGYPTEPWSFSVSKCDMSAIRPSDNLPSAAFTLPNGCQITIKPKAWDDIDGSGGLYKTESTASDSRTVIFDDNAGAGTDCELDLKFQNKWSTPSTSPVETLPSWGSWPYAASCDTGISFCPNLCPTFSQVGTTCYFGDYQCCSSITGGLCIKPSVCSVGGGGCYYNKRCQVQPGMTCTAQGCVSGDFDIAIQTNVLQKGATNTLTAGFDISISSISKSGCYLTGSPVCAPYDEQRMVTETRESCTDCGSSSKPYNIEYCGDGETICGEECDASNPTDPNRANCDANCRLVSCTPTEPGREITCNDGRDNDCNEGPDCADSDCWGMTGTGGRTCCNIDQTCVNAEVTCGPPLGSYPNRYAGCDSPSGVSGNTISPTYTCKECDPCRFNTDCTSGNCCVDASGGPNPGTGQCFGQGIYTPNSKYLCDPPQWK